MTALHLFADTRDWTNLCAVRDGVTCDFNTASPENLTEAEYAMDGPLKAVRWDARGRPHARNLRLGREVRFQALHFAGQTKLAMAAAYRGPSFEGQRGAALRTGGYFRLRRAGARLLGPVVRRLRG